MWFPCFASVEQHDGDALAMALVFPWAICTTKQGAIASSSREAIVMVLLAEWALLTNCSETQGSNEGIVARNTGVPKEPATALVERAAEGDPL